MVAGILLTIFAGLLEPVRRHALVWYREWIAEAACNPLIAALYPANKTTKLNQFHVWFPGGIVIGGLVGYLMGNPRFGMAGSICHDAASLAAYAVLFVGQSMPKTERVEMGVFTGDMFAACLHPVFLLLVICMLLTAAQNWAQPVDPQHYGKRWRVRLACAGLDHRADGGRPSICRPICSSPAAFGMLLAAILSAAGLFLMSQTSGPMLFASATVFAFGVCFFCPPCWGTPTNDSPRLVLWDWPSWRLACSARVTCCR